MLQCYSVGGTALDSSYEPCDTKAVVSSCCQLNHTNPDVCLGSGLCLSTRDEYAGTIWGDGCTDREGNDRTCPHICAGKVDATDYWSVMQCPDKGAWCCRAWKDWTSCCNNTSKSVALKGSDFAALAPSSEATDNNNASAIGGAVGGALGAVVVVLAIAIAYLFRKTRQLKRKDAKQAAPPASRGIYDAVYSPPTGSTSLTRYRTSPQEADSAEKNNPSELQGSYTPPEMNSRSSAPLESARSTL